MEYIHSLLPKSQAQTMLYSGLAVFAVLGLLLMRSRKVMKDTTQNRYIIQEDEVLPNVSYYTHRADQVRNIVITSDWTSIWLLCYYFIVSEQPVQPIFFMDTALPGEVDKLKNIRHKLISQYPHKQSRLLPTYYVITVARHLETSRYIHHLGIKASASVLPNDREYQIMDLAARFATDYPWAVYIPGISGSIYGKLLGADNIKLEGEWDNSRPRIAFNQKLLNNLRFPIIHLPVDKLTLISLDSHNFFYDYLQL